MPANYTTTKKLSAYVYTTEDNFTVGDGVQGAFSTFLLADSVGII